LGQSAFVQGYLPVVLLVDAIKQKKPLPVGFYNAGTQVVTASSVDMANNLPSATFAQLLSLAGDPAATAAFYKPWSDSVRSSDWPSGMQPIAAESE
jgi:hypothetical protein